jgi:exopolysaccharide production protein ExoZ
VDTVKASNREIYGLQLLRAFAALAVVVHHALEESLACRVGPKSPDWLTTAGASGVDIFFVISGVIMLHVSFARAPPVIGPGRFLRRRINRIFPLYWATCICTICLGMVGLMHGKDFTPAVIAQSLVLLPVQNALIGVSWTLSYELYFYILFAATLFLASRAASVLLSSALILSLLFISPSLSNPEFSRFFTNPIAVEFCFGLVLGWAFTQYRELFLIPTICCLPAIVTMAVAPRFVPHSSTAGLEGVARVVWWGIPASLIVATFLSINPSKRSIVLHLVRFGDASYAIYLTHGFIMIAYAYLLKRTLIGDIPQLFLVLLPICISALVGLLAHLVVERRLQTLFRFDKSVVPTPV